MCSEEIKEVFKIVITVLEVIKFIVPVLLIVLCTVDIFKLIVSKKEDDIKKLRKGIIMKIIYCVLIYLIPFLVPFILSLINNILPMNYDDSWKICWDSVKNQEKNK